MISDILSDAISDIEDYLEDPLYKYNMYDGIRGQKIKILVEQMKLVLLELDSPPSIIDLEKSLNT